MLKALLPFLLVGLTLAQIPFNLSQTNKYGNTTILSTLCNQQTQIDFYFNSNSQLSCDGSTCTNTSPGSSTMKFMDINGNDLALTLTNAYAVTNAGVTVTGWGFNPEYYYIFEFATSGNANKVLVLVPTVLSTTANIANNPIVFDVSRLSDLGALQGSSATTLKLNVFNYLNNMDYNKFYHVTDAAKTTTVLLSPTVLKLAGTLTTPLPTSPIAFTPDYSNSGNLLCYASNETSGLFQTHLRENWPLWTCILAVFFYWLYYLLADAETHSIYDKKYDENKWTCWGFYSLHNLAHVQFFSVLSRESLMFFNFSFQAMILAAVYSSLGQKSDPFTHFQIIIWAAAIAFGASLPIPYILGGIFLRGIYNTTLQKFRVIRKSRQTLKKKEEEAVYEQQIDKLQQRLYSYYYIYYVLIFAGFVCFWIPAIYMMMQTRRQWYYLHRIWLASLGIVFVLDHLVFDPLLSFLLGNTRFYRLRGYFYNFQLGQEYKQIEE